VPPRPCRRRSRGSVLASRSDLLPIPACTSAVRCVLAGRDGVDHPPVATGHETSPMTVPQRTAPEEPADAGTVDALHAELGGRWLVTSQGSRHIWDLDAMTYQRLPGNGPKQFDYDGEVHHITRVQV
jgi:hypothetical protein